MPASSAPAAKAALLAALETALSSDGVQVTWNHPAARARKEFVFLGDTELTNSARQLGNGTRQEDYTLEVYAVVHKEGHENAQATEERCWELVAALEGVLSGPGGASDLGLPDGTSILSLTAEYAGARVQSIPEDGGWTAQAAPARVSVSARIR